MYTLLYAHMNTCNHMHTCTHTLTHSLSQKLLNKQKFTYNFGKVPVVLEIGLVVPSQIPVKWLVPSHGSSYAVGEQFNQPGPRPASQPYSVQQQQDCHPWGPPPPYSETVVNFDHQLPPQPIPGPPQMIQGPFTHLPTQQGYYSPLFHQPYPTYQTHGEELPVKLQRQHSAASTNSNLCIDSQVQRQLSLDVVGAKHISPGTEKSPDRLPSENIILSDQYKIFEKLKDKEEKKKSRAENEEKEKRSSAIKVTKLPDGVTNDLLLYYFENERRHGGGEVESVDLDMRTRTAYITFSDFRVVRSVLQKCPHKLNGELIKVEEYSVTSPKDMVHTDTMAVCQTEEEPAAILTVKVEKIPASVSSDTLLYYFENRKRSGGGEIETIDYKDGVALITFKEESAVTGLLQKCPHRINGKCIEVTRVGDVLQTKTTADGQTGEGETEILTLKVEKIPASVSSDTLLYYFENKKRSGGGDVEKLHYNGDGVAMITFREESAVSGVMKQSHTLEGSHVVVSEIIPLKLEQTYENKLLIRELNINTTKECLCDFLEVQISVSATDVVYGDGRETALVTFEEKPDFEKLQDACSRKTLEGVHLKIDRVPISNCILVTNIGKKITEDALTFYFANPKRGGGDIEKVVFEKGKKCFVYFKESSVMESICKRSHVINGQKLTIRLYYDCLEPKCDREEATLVVPDPVIILEQDSTKMEFLKKSKANKKALQNQIAKCHGKIVWPSKQSDECVIIVHCTITTELAGWMKIVSNWETTVRQTVVNFLNKFEVRIFSVIPESWENVITQLKSVTVPSSGNVAVITDVKLSRVVVCGFQDTKDNVTIVSDIIEKIVESIETEFRKKEETDTTEPGTFTMQSMTDLRFHQMKLIQILNFPDKLQRKYQNLKVTLTIKHPWKISFEGTVDDITAAKLEIYRTLQEIVSTELQNMSAGQADLMHSRYVIGYLIDRLREAKVYGVWEIVEGKITVFGFSHNEVDKVGKIIQNSVVEYSLDIEKESVPIFSTSQWDLQLADIMQKFVNRVRMLIEVENLKVLIYVTDDLATVIPEIVINFLKSNTIRKKFLSYKTGVVRSLELSFDKLKDLEKDLKQYQVRIAFADNHTGLEIEGTEDGVREAHKKINAMVTRISRNVAVPSVLVYSAEDLIAYGASPLARRAPLGWDRQVRMIPEACLKEVSF
ncbi:hypothetical protein ScPMuIL_001180 [Solemya velum]